jgi:hypothetical protein
MTSLDRVVRNVLLLGFAGLLVFPGRAVADDVDPGWSFSFEPYGWLLSLSGDIGVDGEAFHVDLPFHDILEDLNFGFMGVFEARRGRWFGIVDGVVAQLDADARFGRSSDKADLDVWLTKLKLVGGYRLLSRPLGAETDPRRLTIDAYAGGRLWYVDTDVKLEFPRLGDRRLSSDTWWIDPVLGLRVQADVTDRFLLKLVGDLGGFDIGSASEFTWELQGTVAYRLTERWRLAGGYRAIGVDRERGVDGLDGTLHGPFLGVVYAWGADGR